MTTYAMRTVMFAERQELPQITLMTVVLISTVTSAEQHVMKASISTTIAPMPPVTAAATSVLLPVTSITA